MTFIEPDPGASNDHRTQEVYDRQIRAFGYLPNYAPLFSHRPDVIDLWSDLQRGLCRHIEPRLRELATFAAAVALKSSYCTLAHGVKLRDFFSDSQIMQLAAGSYGAVVDDREALAMRYAAQVAVDATSVTDAVVEALRNAGYNDAEIFDLAGIAAGRAFFSKLVEGLGAHPDTAYRELPAALRSALTVGREIEPICRKTRPANHAISSRCGPPQIREAPGQASCPQIRTRN